MVLEEKCLSIDYAKWMQRKFSNIHLDRPKRPCYLATVSKVRKQHNPQVRSLNLQVANKSQEITT